MKVLKIISFLAIATLLITSCKKFLDVKPKGIIIAEDIGDYEAILNDEKVVLPFGRNGEVIYPTDDVRDYGLSPQNQTSVKGNIYFWREYINDEKEAPEVWSLMYNNIANLNLVTEEVLTANGGSEQKKKQFYAEAMLSKVFCYYHLLSFFAPAYEKSTAPSLYGVPYVTSTDVSQPEPKRPTLEESYAQMIEDATNAIPDLPLVNINKSRPTKAAAYGMLARIYMSMGDFENALKYADMVLDAGGEILDYNDYAGAELPSAAFSPEELWLKYSYNIGYKYSNELLDHYNLNADLRIALNAKQADDGSYTFGGSDITNVNRGISYAEIFLDKAECLARKGDVSGALEIVNNKIRKNRFAPADYVALRAATKEEAIYAVLEERRRELAFKGLRWSDMKRLDIEGRMPAVKRYANDGVTVLETLEPGSSKYTFQIPLSVQAFNPGMPLNKR